MTMKPKDLTPRDCQRFAAEAWARSDSIKPDTPMNRYSIAACEVWASAMDRIARGDGPEAWELFLAFRRQKRLTVLYGVDP